MAATAHAPHHRPALDGIRTLAVYLVVAFHAGSGALGGGFVGVDVFFVLSGYLVTQVLLRDLTGGGGRIRFARFYARRVRRLLPAAVVTVVVTAAVYGAVAPRGALGDAAASMRAALLYVANWHFIDRSADYFAPAEPSPVLHFWSLAVEEQFYVVWPVLLAGLWRLGRRRRRVVAGLVGAGAVASFAWMLVLRADAPTRAYFGTDTRAYQLLVGAALALLPGLVARLRARPAAAALAPVGLVGVVGIATSLADQGPFARSAVATAAAAGLILGVEAFDRSPVARALSLRPVTYLGSISYATYLWHWPVIVVARELGLATSAATLALLTALVATGIAALSSELLELPVRRSGRLDRHRGPVLAGGVAVSVLAALLVLPPLLDEDRARTTLDPGPGGAVQGGTPVPGAFDLAEVRAAGFGHQVDCTDGPAEACTVVDGPGTHVLLVGDSNAVMLVPAFRALARAEGLRFSAAVVEGCPWQLGFVHLSAEFRSRCRDYRPDTYERLVPELDPDVVVLVNTRLLAGNGPAPADDEARTLADATATSLDRLEASGAVVVLVAPPPLPPDRFDPLECLDQASVSESCAFDAAAHESWLDEALAARAAASPSIHLLDWGRLVCPRLPRCDAIVGDVPVFWNPEHITLAWSEQLADPIGRELAAIGALPPRGDEDG